MKALTLHPYFATEMLVGNKTIECRTWQRSGVDEIVICSSAKKEKGCICGYALLTAKVKDIVPFTKEHLELALMDKMPEQKCFAWILDDFKPIYPVAVKGQQGIFNIDIEIKYIDDGVSEEELDKIYENLFY